MVQSKFLASEKIGNSGRCQTINEGGNGTERVVKKSIKALKRDLSNVFEDNDAMGPVNIIKPVVKIHKQSGLRIST